MSQKRRRILMLEHLEDRTVLTGVVTTSQDAVGVVHIMMGGTTPGIEVNGQGGGRLGPAKLVVQPVPGTFTTISGPTSFDLSSVHGLAIAAGNGSNQIFLGDLAGFTLNGNISIDTGSGASTVSLNKIRSDLGGVIFNGTHGAGTGTDTVTMTDTTAALMQITPGRGKLTLTQTKISTGFDLIFAARSQLASDSICIMNSMQGPSSLVHAIGQLTITDGNGNNSFFIDSIDAGFATIISGKGDNSLTFSHSKILTNSTTLGTEAPGARGNNTVVMDGDKVTGQFMTLRVLNESGLSGVIGGGGAGVQQTTNNVAPNPDGGHRSPIHINHVALSNLLFTTPFPATTPQMLVQIDDGDYYYDTQRAIAIGGTTFVATNVCLPGLASMNLGDHVQLLQLGQLGTVTNGIPAGTATNIFKAGQLLLLAENDLDTVIVSANVTGNSIPSPFSPVPFILPATESVNLGDNTINPVQGTPFPASATNNQLPPPSIFTYGNVGTALIQGNMTLNIGNNLSIPGNVNGNNAGEPRGWPVKTTETITGSVASGFFGAPAFPTGNLNLTPTTQGKLETGVGGGAGQGVVSPAGENNGLAVLIDPSSIPGDLNVILGSGGFSHRESLVIRDLTAGNIFAQLNSDGTEIPGANHDLGVYIGLENVLVTDEMFGDLFTGSPPGLTLVDIGHGADTVYLGVTPKQALLTTSVFGFAGPDSGRGPQATDRLTMLGQLFVTLSDSGVNGVEAHNTTCALGIISGFGVGGVAIPGFPGFNVFVDDGGNAHVFLENFHNYP